MALNLLLTGFEPFGQSSVNPSEQVVHALKREGVHGVALSTKILPVDRVRGPESLLAAVRHSKPDAVLCLGQAYTRSVISIERIAVNLMDYRIPDNAGHQVEDAPILPDGPAAFFTTLPLRSMLKAIRAAGIPAELSLSAGSFLCNQVIYALLYHLDKEKWNVPAGFIHLPPLPEQIAGDTLAGASMSLETMVSGIRAAIMAIEQVGTNGHARPYRSITSRTHSGRIRSTRSSRAKSGSAS